MERVQVHGSVAGNVDVTLDGATVATFYVTNVDKDEDAYTRLTYDQAVKAAESLAHTLRQTL